jgi:hypothetical protein
LVKPLTDARLPLKLADGIGLAVAHGTFRDLLTDGLLVVRGDAALDAAAQQANERRLAGSHALERYEPPVDQAPLVAAELAVWALGQVVDYEIMNSAW